MKKIALLAIIIFLLSPILSFARENVNYWYIKELNTEIKVREDSVLEITEDITADCGNAIGKHGIFRIVPTTLKTEEKTYQTPIELISITNFEGEPLKYETIKTRGTITWKIGDPNITVKGINEYRIKYELGNAIRTGHPDYDEFYFNVLGSFWDLEIDKFSATIIFPETINKGNTEVEYYTGKLGEKSKSLANYEWEDENIIKITSTRTLYPGEGITLSVTFPKNLVSPYEFTFWQKYGKFFWLILPLSVAIIVFYLWKRFGKDFKIDKPVIAEFEAPENMPPIETGLLTTNGTLNSRFITAEIINMAVKGMIKIKEVENEVLFFKYKDYELTRTGKKTENEYEKTIIEKIFGNKERVLTSDFRKASYRIKMRSLTKKISKIFYTKKLVIKTGKIFFGLFIAFGLAAIIVGIVSIGIAAMPVAGVIALIISGLIPLTFSFIMPKRTLKGAELLHKIKGLKLYMKTAEKYRQQFYEKENIFDKLLPYAIVFNMTKLWIKKMETIYGKDYYKKYHPVWYAGAVGSFDANSFASTISSMSSQISSNVSSGTGAGGSGGAGGGAGGGGGGGW